MDLLHVINNTYGKLVHKYVKAHNLKDALNGERNPDVHNLVLTSQRNLVMFKSDMEDHLADIIKFVQTYYIIDIKKISFEYVSGESSTDFLQYVNKRVYKYIKDLSGVKNPEYRKDTEEELEIFRSMVDRWFGNVVERSGSVFKYKRKLKSYDYKGYHKDRG